MRPGEGTPRLLPVTGAAPLPGDLGALPALLHELNMRGGQVGMIAPGSSCPPARLWFNGPPLNPRV